MRRMVCALGLVALCAVSVTQAALPFPEDFRWGTAISGFQSDMGFC